MREIMVRRGREWFEWKYREENESKFRTTLIPRYPLCQKPARCRWCEGMQVGPVMLSFPFRTWGEGPLSHVVTPANGCHLVAMEYCQAHPDEPITAGWVLTEEEVMAGKKGFEWPEK